MTVDRERTLQVAESFLEAQKFDRALEEFQKIIQADPSDTRILLKIGDLQVRWRDYAGAIATYERVADFYAKQGFALKAIAVYKQIRELVQKHTPSRAEHYAYVADRLAALYIDLGLLSEALSTLDEEANWLRARDREQDAAVIYRRMVQLSPQNPVPHLRLAEGLCRIGDVENAMVSFWTAADLLIAGGRADDALRVFERMLHFKQDPKIAKGAARVYLDKGTQAEGMQALSRLQICFQADPKDVETLQLLAEAFEVIDQSSKALEVRKEIVRQAHEQGNVEVFRATLKLLQAQAPEDQQVRALTQLPPPKKSSGPSAHLDAPPMPAIPRAPANPRMNLDTGLDDGPQDLETIEELEFIEDSGVEMDIDLVVEPPASAARKIASSFPASSQPAPSASLAQTAVDLDGDLARASDPGPDEPESAVVPLTLSVRSRQVSDVPPTHADDRESSLPPIPLELPAQSAAAPPTTRMDRAAETRVTRPQGDVEAHTRRALADATAFRGLRLLDKAIETIQMALEFDPQSIELRESLRDLYVEQGDRDGAIEEMLTMAAIYIEYDRPDHAQTVLINVLEAVPEHPVATRTLAQLTRQATSSMPPPSSLPPVSSGPLPRFEPKAPDSDGSTVEEALEEAEFFVSRGLFEDALLILSDQLDRAPGHPLLLDSIREIREAMADAGLESGRAEEPAPPSGQVAVGSVPPSSRAPISSAPREAAPDSRQGEFDLKRQLGELERAVRESQRPPPGKRKKPASVDVDRLFDKFKAKVKSQVSENDCGTHYDLGVAYKEMRLFGDAIEELKLAARDPNLECNCYSMIGLIYAEQERWEDAAKGYTRALGSVKKTVAQEASLYYDLGHAHEQMGLMDKAAYYFQQVMRRDSSFRDIKERIAEGRRRSQPVKATVNGDDELDRAFEELLGD